MTVEIHIPTPLRKFTNDQAAVSVEGQTVGEALENLVARHAELRERIFTEDGTVRRFVNVFANDEDVRFMDQLATPLEPGDSVSIVPAIAGGVA